jgi:2-polyprenyl-3-methyl-5-hydroxy-6-metoxy-1,4-benzoquinol methylase
MLVKMADSRDPNSLAARFRRKRFAFFMELITRVHRPMRILDVGGTQSFWQSASFTSPGDVNMTLLNVSKEQTSLPNFTSVVGDARRMEFEEQSFDVVFSNSVIEHVGTYDDQASMAREIRRVGKRYFVQTPNKYFPIEPHFVFPAFQFLPLGLRIWLLRHMTLGSYKKVSDYETAKSQVENVQLLSRRELQALFPTAKLQTETFCGLAKSFTAYDGW